MKVCSYCHLTVSESDLVCPHDGEPSIEVEPAPIDRELLNRFESIAFFGSGSTGDLYLANDSLSQQHGLLKILRTTSRNYAAERIRIKRELSKQTRFTNHVVPVIAIGESGEEEQAAEKNLWVFRQRIDGESLKVYLKREGRLKVSIAIGIAAQIVMGLDTIHRAGLLHRDIKPGHVMLQSHASGLPQVFLLDTGISARIETKSLFDLVGTGEYISPEQIGGKLSSYRSDLYALGCVFYEMLVGRPPFIGKDTAAIFKEHQTEPPPVADVDLPDPLRSLIGSMLAKEPRERPFSDQQVFRVLEPFLPPSPLFKSPAISSYVQAPQPVVTNQPTKTVSGVVSPASVPPLVPPPSRGSMSSPPPVSAIKSSIPPLPPRVRHSNLPRPTSPKGSVAPLTGVNSSVPPRITGVKSSIPPPPPRNRHSNLPRPTSPTGSVAPFAGVNGSIPPLTIRARSSVPPPPVPRGPTAISRDVAPNDFIPKTTDISSNTAEQTDGETPKELELLIEDIEDIVAPEVGTATAESPEDSEATPEERPEAKSPAATEEAGALDEGDRGDQSEETDTVRISGRALDEVQSLSFQDATEEQFATAPDEPEPIGQTYRSNRPSVDFRVESLFDDELPQSDSLPSETAHDSYPLSEGPVEISSDIHVPPVADPEGTAPIRMLRRYDRRLVIGVVSGLVLSAILLFAISDWESDSDKTVDGKPNPTASSPAPKSAEERDNAVSAPQSPKAPPVSAAKEEPEPSKGIQPTEIAKQDVVEKAQPADDSEPKRSSRSKSQKSSARAPSRNTSSDGSTSATKLRTEAREHYAAGRYKSAATAYRKIAKMKPLDAGAFAGLGASYLALNRAKRAITAYQRAIKLQPNNSGFHAALARAYATKGDRGRAIKIYQKALRINPRNRIAKVALRQLTEK